METAFGVRKAKIFGKINPKNMCAVTDSYKNYQHCDGVTGCKKFKCTGSLQLPDKVIKGKCYGSL